MNKLRLWLVVADGINVNDAPVLYTEYVRADDAGEAWRIFTARHSQQVKYKTIAVCEAKQC